uniref:ATP synthase F0 subunit 8 n=1 Tax=Amynthas carnosus TaxID=585683 RepID=A0A142AFS2_9ANNE|nr:ATP synthase F0 subunit 8 [Amynthas carnosus]AMO26933.1 ATP synthase F0 subunit 8 [Amynthas carnosus]BDQ43865.1 ATP synthase F0 subunit 8 [Amynthas carnosus]
MPHLSPMSWLTAIATLWIIMMLYTSNIWWTNLHTFEADFHKKIPAYKLPWPWT